jgi:hypothetical protein
MIQDWIAPVVDKKTTKLVTSAAPNDAPIPGSFQEKAVSVQDTHFAPVNSVGVIENEKSR